MVINPNSKIYLFSLGVLFSMVAMGDRVSPVISSKEFPEIRVAFLPGGSEPSADTVPGVSLQESAGDTEWVDRELTRYDMELQVPRSTYFVLDTRGRLFASKKDVFREPLITFVEGKGSQDKIGLVGYKASFDDEDELVREEDDYRVLSPLTAKIDEVQKGLDGLEFRGQHEFLIQALHFAMEALDTSSNASEDRRVIVLSHGGLNQVHKFKSPPPFPALESGASLPVFLVVPKREIDKLHPTFKQHISETGGRVFGLKKMDTESISGVLSEIDQWVDSRRISFSYTTNIYNPAQEAHHYRIGGLGGRAPIEITVPVDPEARSAFLQEELRKSDQMVRDRLSGILRPWKESVRQLARDGKLKESASMEKVLQEVSSELIRNRTLRGYLNQPIGVTLEWEGQHADYGHTERARKFILKLETAADESLYEAWKKAFEKNPDSEILNTSLLSAHLETRRDDADQMVTALLRSLAELRQKTLQNFEGVAETGILTLERPLLDPLRSAGVTTNGVPELVQQLEAASGYRSLLGEKTFTVSEWRKRAEPLSADLAALFWGASLLVADETPDFSLTTQDDDQQVGTQSAELQGLLPFAIGQVAFSQKGLDVAAPWYRISISHQSDDLSKATALLRLAVHELETGVDSANERCVEAVRVAQLAGVPAEADTQVAYLQVLNALGRFNSAKEWAKEQESVLSDDRWPEVMSQTLIGSIHSSLDQGDLGAALEDMEVLEEKPELVAAADPVNLYGALARVMDANRDPHRAAVFRDLAGSKEP